MYLPFSRKQHRKDNSVLSASRSWYFAVLLHCISNCYIFRPDKFARVSRLKKNNNNNNFSTCKWPNCWCQWINSFHPSYFNPWEKGRALTRQLTCPSVRLFLHCTKCINYSKIMHSQSTLVIYFFGVIQRKQQVLLDFFCKTRLPSKCWRFESNFVIKVGVWLGIFFIYSKPLYISILEDLTVTCKLSSIPLLLLLFFFFFFLFVNLIYCLF